MDDVRFDEQPSVVKTPLSGRREGMIDFLVRQGYARDQKTAHTILIGVLVLLIMATAAVFLLGNGSNSIGEPQPLPEDLIR